MLLAAGSLSGLALLALAVLYWRRRRSGAQTSAIGRQLRGAAAAALLSGLGLLVLDAAEANGFWGYRYEIRWAENHWLPLLWLGLTAAAWWLAARRL